MTPLRGTTSNGDRPESSDGDFEAPAAPQPARDAEIDVPNEQQQHEICALVSIGIPQHVATRYVLLGDVGAAADDDARYRAALFRAQWSTDIRQLQNLQAAGEKHWQAAAWMLERLNPNRYARRGPEVITAEQLDYALTRLTDVVLSHVPEPERRDKIQAELALLADELAQAQDADPT